MTASGNSIYREQIIDHYRHPRNFGSLADCDVRRRESNYSCGDDLEFFIKIKGGCLTDIRFQGQGCALSVAAASMLTEKAVGRTVDQVMKLDERDIIRMLGVGELTGSRLRCAVLGLKGVQAALSQTSSVRPADRKGRKGRSSRTGSSQGSSQGKGTGKSKGRGSATKR